MATNGNATIAGTLTASNFSGSSSGTNTGDVTLAGSANYLSLSGQQITQNAINLGTAANVTGTLANARLTGSGALTVTAGTGLSGGGSVALGGSTTLNLATTGTGAPFVQGGNSFGATAVLGTKDNNSLQFITNNSTAFTLDTSNNGTLAGNLTVQGTGTSTFSGSLSVGGTITVTDFNSVKASLPANTVVGSDTTSLAQSPIGAALWHDLFAFDRYATPTYEQYDGAAWNSATLNNSLFAEKENQAITIFDGSATTGARWTWYSTNFSYSTGAWLNIGFAYTNPAATKTIQFESSADGVNWTTRHISTGNTQNAAPAWFYVTSYGGDPYLRLTITGTSSGSVNLSAIKLMSSRWGNQGGGSEMSYPYTWDGSQNITTGGTLATTGNLNVNGSGNLQIAGTNVISSGRAIQNATGLVSSGTIQFSSLTTNGFVKTTGSNGTLSVSSTVNLASEVSGTLPNSNLTGSGALTVTAGNGLTGGGSVALGSSTSLTVGAGSCITVGATTVGVTNNCVDATTLDGQDSTAFASASGSANYIQNQNASAQTTANFWISGNGKVNGTFTASSTSNSVFGNGTTGGLQIGDGTVTKTSGSGFLFNSSVNGQSGLYTGAGSGTQRITSTGVIQNITGYTQTAGSATFNQNAADILTVTSGSNATTTDQLVVDNTGSTGTATAAINNVNLKFKGSTTTAVENSSLRVDLTPGTFSGSTTSGLRVALTAAPATGTTGNGFKLDTLTTGGAGTYNGLLLNGVGTLGSGTETAISIQSNWDAALKVGSNVILNGSGVLQSAGLSGTYSNALTLSSSSNSYAGTWNGNTVAVNKGGTGITSYTIGDLLYASGATTLSKLADVASGSCLRSGGVGAAPTWGACGSTITLQGAYDVSTGGTTPEIVLDSTRTSLDVQGYSGQSADLLDLRSYAASGLGTLQFGVSPSGNVTAAGDINLGSNTKSYKINGSTVIGLPGGDTQSIVVGVSAGAALSGTGNDHTLVGTWSGGSITTGFGNTAVGWSGLRSTTTGGENAALGLQAGYTNTTGTGNTLLGAWADVGSAGLQNATAIGYFSTVTTSNSLVLGGTGSYAVKVGIGTTSPSYTLDSVGDINTSAYFRVGGNIVLNVLTATSNTFVGVSAGNTSATGNYNVAVGQGALNLLTSGASNTALGQGALNKVTTGSSNVGIGANALQNTTTGSYNVAIGLGALSANISGDSGVAIGLNALNANTSGTQNTALGTNALQANTTGLDNAALGHGALFANVGGNYNTAIGQGSLNTNVSGSSNSALGEAALQYSTGSNNAAVGVLAGRGNAAGYSSTGNVLLGNSTGLALQSGSDYNTLVGYQSGTAITTGANNTLLGKSSGANLTTGGNNIIIGANINAPSATGSYQLDIGDVVYGDITSGQKNLAVGVNSFYGKLTVAGSIAVQELASAPSSTSGYGKLYVGSSDHALHFINNSGTDTIVAPGSKKITLPAEYAGSILDVQDDATCTSASSGTMTSGLNVSGSTRMNYYNWTAASTSQCYDVVVQVPIPADFTAWSSAPTLWTYNSNGTNTTSVKVDAYDTSGTAVTGYGYTGVSSGTTFASNSLPSLSGTYTAGGYMTLKIRMTNPAANANVRIGTLTFTYR